MQPSSIDLSRPFSNLNEYIHNATDRTSWGGRLWRSIKMVWKEKGALTGVATVAGIALAKAYTVAYGYLLLEGSYRSLNETYIALKEEGHLVHEPGDAGGWTSLAIFTTLAFGTILTQCIKEGEYLNLKPLCQRWYKDITKTGNIQISPQAFYFKVNDILDNLSSGCFFSKNIINRRIIALDILEDIEENTIEEQPEKLSELHLDKQLRPIYQQIQEQLNYSLSFRCYLYRLNAGLSNIKQFYGPSGKLIALINGIALPIVLVGCAFLSACGEVILTKEVLVERKDLLLTGHVGEWPDNFVEAL